MHPWTRRVGNSVGRLLLIATVLVTSLSLGMSTPPTYAQAPLEVTVTIEHVQALDCHEEIDTPLGEVCLDSPDMYGIITIGGREWVSRPIDGEDEIRPGWRYTVPVAGSDRELPIHIEIWDDDDGFGSLRGGDDHVDLTNGDDRNLDLKVNVRSCAIRGDVATGCWRQITTSGTENDRAAITVVVDVSLPRTIFWGHLYDATPPDRSSPVAAHRVTLIDEDTGTPLAATTTDDEGGFGFDIRPPADSRVRLEIAPCEGVIACTHAVPDVAPIDLQPIAQTERSLLFNGCPSEGFCRYAPVDFFLQRDLTGVPPLSIEEAQPGQPQPPLILRDNPLKRSDPGVKISGSGMHSWMQAFLFPADCVNFPNCASYPALITRIAPDGRAAHVEIPQAVADLGLTAFRKGWFWGLRNMLARGTPGEWQRLGTTHLNYPTVHGFAFANISDPSDAPTWDEFTAVFGDNASICVGALGICAFRVTDPFAWLYFETVYQLAAGGEGECVGMAATSQLMAQGVLGPSTFRPSTYAVNGLPGAPENDSLPPRPQQFDPRNLWGEILTNHGVQASSQGFNAYMDDTGKNGIFSIGGDPAARLAELRADPGGQVVCMNKGASGHCVTAYAVEDIDAQTSKIWVYDNRYPNNADDYILVNRAANTYQLFQGDGQPDSDYSGTHLTTMPLGIWRGERTIPGLFDALRFGLIAIFGAATPHYRTADGMILGEQSDGTFVEAVPGARVIPSLSQGQGLAHSPLIAIDPQAATPDILLTGQGGAYRYANIGDGMFFQLAVTDSLAGAVDRVRPVMTDGAIRGFAFTPQQAVTAVAPHILLAPASDRRAGFSWVGLDVAAGGTAGFSGARDAYQVAYQNDTGAATTHHLVLEHIDGAAEMVAKRYFGPFQVPAGATQRATIIDWPIGSRLRIELDRDSDGLSDETTIARGVVPGERVQQGLVALYTFDEGSGAIAHDTASANSPHHLTIADPAAVRWRDGMLQVISPTMLMSNGPATTLIDAFQASGEISIEAWVRSQAVEQIGLAQIAGFSAGPREINAVLSQEREGDLSGDGYVGRLRTTTNSAGRDPDLKTKINPNPNQPTHVVYTRDALGTARLYINGIARDTDTIDGDLSNWDRTFRLLIANTASGDRPWLGELHLVGLYNRALSTAEVEQNFLAGADGRQLAPYSGVVSSYRFDEGQGAAIHDSDSTTGGPLNLTFDPVAARWVPQGLEVHTPTIISSSVPARKLIDASGWTDEISIELWVDPAGLASALPTPIIGIADNARAQHIELAAQAESGGKERVIARLHSYSGSGIARPTVFKSRPSLIGDGPVHLVFTRDALGLTRWYINGQPQGQRSVMGSLANWDDWYRLYLANEPDGSRPWLGIYRSVVIYNRALSPAEVQAHFHK